MMVMHLAVRLCLPAKWKKERHQAAFLADLTEVWAAEGKQTMLATARANPEVFFGICSRLIPKDVELTIRQHSPELDQSDLAILRAVKAVIPNAGDRPADQVFNEVLDAMRAYSAKLVDAT
jgi:hypothetical protein